jgi:hypothetical protein
MTINFKKGTVPVDAGDNTDESIQPVTDGERVSATIANRPNEVLRARTEVLKEEVDTKSATIEMDRGLVLASPGRLYFSGIWDPNTNAVPPTHPANIPNFDYTDATSANDSGVAVILQDSVQGASSDQFYLRAINSPPTTEFASLSYTNPATTSVELLFSTEVSVNGGLNNKFAFMRSNEIEIEVKPNQAGASPPTISMEGGEIIHADDQNTLPLLENRIVVSAASGETVQSVCDAINAHPVASQLVYAITSGNTATDTDLLIPRTRLSETLATGATLTGAGAIILTGKPGVDAEKHILTAAILLSFFVTTPDDHCIQHGDSICVDFSSDLNRRRSVDNVGTIGSSIEVGMLFNSRTEPERLPHSIPLIMNPGIPFGPAQSQYIVTPGGHKFSTGVPSSIGSSVGELAQPSGGAMIGMPAVPAPPLTAPLQSALFEPLNVSPSNLAAGSVASQIAQLINLVNDRVARDQGAVDGTLTVRGSPSAGTIIADTPGLAIGNTANPFDAYLQVLRLFGTLLPGNANAKVGDSTAGGADRIPVHASDASADQVVVGAENLSSTALLEIARIVTNYQQNTVQWTLLYESSPNVPWVGFANDYKIYARSLEFALVINATWDTSTPGWSRPAGTGDSFLVGFGWAGGGISPGLYSLIQPAASPDSWLDSYGAGAWEQSGLRFANNGLNIDHNYRDTAGFLQSIISISEDTQTANDKIKLFSLDENKLFNAGASLGGVSPGVTVYYSKDRGFEVVTNAEWDTSLGRWGWMDYSNGPDGNGGGVATRFRFRPGDHPVVEYSTREFTWGNANWQDDFWEQDPALLNGPDSGFSIEYRGNSTLYNGGTITKSFNFELADPKYAGTGGAANYPQTGKGQYFYEDDRTRRINVPLSGYDVVPHSLDDLYGGTGAWGASHIVGQPVDPALSAYYEWRRPFGRNDTTGGSEFHDPGMDPTSTTVPTMKGNHVELNFYNTVVSGMNGRPWIIWKFDPPEGTFITGGGYSVSSEWDVTGGRVVPGTCYAEVTILRVEKADWQTAPYDEVANPDYDYLTTPGVTYGTVGASSTQRPLNCTDLVNFTPLVNAIPLPPAEFDTTILTANNDFVLKDMYDYYITFGVQIAVGSGAVSQGRVLLHELYYNYKTRHVLMP